MPEKVIAYTDGGSRGNPGPAAAGFVLSDTDGTPLVRKAFFIGKATNNAAEYHAVLIALEELLVAGVRSIVLYTDSQLVARQLNGIYKVKDEGLKKIYLKVKDKLRDFEKMTILHIPREKNKEADRLANKAIDERRVSKPGR